MTYSTAEAGAAVFAWRLVAFVYLNATIHAGVAGVTMAPVAVEFETIESITTVAVNARE
jgi:hypothetical protein